MSREISDQSKSKDELIRSEKLYRNVFNFSPFVIGLLNKRGILININDAVENLLSIHTKQDILGKNFVDILSLNERNKPLIPIFEDHFDKLLKGETLASFDFKLYRSKDGYFWCRFDSSLVKLDDEDIIQFILQNITKYKEAEQKLKDSEEKLSKAFNNRFVAVSISDLKEGRFIEVNDVFLNNLGLKREDVIGKTSLELNIWKDQSVRDEILRIIQEKGNISNFEIINETSSGKVRYGLFSANLIEINNEHFLLSMVNDITARVLAEQKLKESEERFRSLFKGGPLFTIAWQKVDDDFILLDYNNIFLNTVSQVKEDLGITATEMFLKRQYRPDLIEDLNRCFEEKSTFSKETKLYINFLNRERDLRIMWSYVPPDLVLTYIEDITRRKRAEQELKESEAKFRTAFDSSAISMSISTIEEGRFVEANDVCIKDLGFKREEIIGKTSKELNLWVDRVQRNLMVQSVKEKGNVSNMQIKYRTKDGKIKFGLFSENIIYLNEKPYLLNIVNDITDRVLNEEKLRESEKDFREAYNRVEFYKDLFTHDVNNMLQSILSSNQLISMLSPSKEEKEKLGVFLDIINSEVNRGRKLVNSIKKLSLIEEKEILIENIEILSILIKIIDKIKDSIRDKDVQIKTDSKKEEFYVQANNLIKDVFQNLITNSIRHNRNEKVEILIKISGLKENDINYCKMEFIDNGIGIEDLRKKEIFFRGSSERMNLYGIGLGLTLVYKIIETYNGRIWVEDRIKGDYSKGSNFIILIPESDTNG